MQRERNSLGYLAPVLKHASRTSKVERDHKGQFLINR